MSPNTVAHTLQTAMSTLAAHSESPRLDAEVLLAKVLGLSRTGLLVRGAELVAPEHRSTYHDLIARRAHGTPVAYLTGTREFWSLRLTVTADVLVPRPETELLVEKALEHIPAGQECSVLDLGTGTGAIALAIASERPQAQITGVDVSAAALAIAVRNGEDLGLVGDSTTGSQPRINWRLGSWFDAVPGERFDIIVSNPPYIAADDLALPLLAAEPRLALTCGPTGLEALRVIAARAPQHLNTHGWLLLEHGSAQAADVAQLLAAQGFRDIRSHADYSGKPRVTLGTFHSAHQENT